MVIEALPRLPNGKIDRKVLPTPDRHRAREVARGRMLNDIERRVAEIWAAVLGVQEIDQSADFFDLGGHSLLAVRLLARVEAEFGIRISVSALFSASKIGAFTKLIERSDKCEFDFRQVVRLQPEGSKPALFAINNTGIYGTLSKRLGGDQPATALQLFDPSFPRGSMPGSIKEIAEQYVQLIRDLQPAGPYALIGWCRGGVIAFETARQMAAAGESISQLIVIDTWVPGYYRRLGPLNSVLAKYAYRWQLVERDWNEVRRGHRTVREFVAARTVFNRLLGRRPADAASEPEYLSAERYDEWLLAYLERLLCAYEPEPFRGPMTVFRSAGEPAGRFLDSKMGWNEFATEGVELVVVPGDHFSIFRDPGVALMAKHISAALDGAQAGD
jgi:thioesterase domain-containing protein/acyl carrier protein